MVIHAVHSLEIAGRASAYFAGEVRAEMARLKLTAGALAKVLGITPHTAGRRLSGEIPFSAIEMALVAMWLRVDLAELVRRSMLAALSERPDAAELVDLAVVS